MEPMIWYCFFTIPNLHNNTEMLRCPLMCSPIFIVVNHKQIHQNFHACMSLCGVELWLDVLSHLLLSSQINLEWHKNNLRTCFVHNSTLPAKKMIRSIRRRTKKSFIFQSQSCLCHGTPFNVSSFKRCPITESIFGAYGHMFHCMLSLRFVSALWPVSEIFNIEINRIKDVKKICLVVEMENSVDRNRKKSESTKRMNGWWNKQPSGQCNPLSKGYSILGVIRPHTRYGRFIRRSFIFFSFSLHLSDWVVCIVLMWHIHCFFTASFPWNRGCISCSRLRWKLNAVASIPCLCNHIFRAVSNSQPFQSLSDSSWFSPLQRHTTNGTQE